MQSLAAHHDAGLLLACVPIQSPARGVAHLPTSGSRTALLAVTQAVFPRASRSISPAASGRAGITTLRGGSKRDFSGTVTPPGHWNQIARAIAAKEKVSLVDKARLLALLNVALSDAGIVCWEAKYHYNWWRPVTAIRRADEDNNPETSSDAEWQPLLITPPFPEHVSGHSMFSGAAGEILLRFFGRDQLTFSVTSDTLPGVVRTYHSVGAVVSEIGRSRILGGIHFRSADESGRAAGRTIAGGILDQRFARMEN